MCGAQQARWSIDLHLLHRWDALRLKLYHAKWTFLKRTQLIIPPQIVLLFSVMVGRIFPGDRAAFTMLVELKIVFTNISCSSKKH